MDDDYNNWMSRLHFHYVRSCCSVLKHVQLFAATWIAAHQASCTSLSPRVCSNSCPSSQWCHPTNSIQWCHPLLSPSPPVFNLSQHQGLFQWVSSFYQVAKVLELVSASVLSRNIWDWFPLRLTGLISFLSKEFSGVFSTTTNWRHQLERQLLRN